MKQHIRTAAVFAGLSPASVDRLTAAGRWVVLWPGEKLFSSGDEADALYLISEGKLEELQQRPAGPSYVVAELGPGDLAGEIQVLTGGRRSSTVRAVSSSTVMRFSLDAVEELAEYDPAFVESIRTLVLSRLRRGHFFSMLPAQFGDLDFRQMEEIESLGSWVKLQNGETLFRQGDEGDGAYLLVSGLLRVLVRTPEGPYRLANYIRHGQIVGEMAVLSDEPRSATIYATRESDLLFFAKKQFSLLLEKHPRFTLSIARMNIDRLRHSNSLARPAAGMSVTAIVPASDAVPMAEFSCRLAEGLAQYSAVLHVDRKRLQNLLGAPDESVAAREILLNARFPAWLSSEEGRHAFILLETDLSDPEWTERCIRHADQVLTVGLAAASPELSDIETRFVYSQVGTGELQKRLVLIHSDDAVRPRGTARWLKLRPVEMHHHVRLGDKRDFERLARFLTGSAICLALGGGGARGFAHIGAIRAFRDEGLPIDIVGGTSMGAVIAAELALGMSPEEMVRANGSLFSNTGLALDATLPLLSFTTGKAYAGTLKQTFSDIEIEDLWIPFFCVSSNISRAVRAIHRTGLLWRMVRASSSVQGMFPPIVLDGELHIDGAPFANLPADAMKSVCDGKVIALDVSPPVDLVRNTDYGDSVSGWRILWNRLFPGSQDFRYAGLGAIMQRAGEAVSMANQKLIIERMADYYLRIPVDEFGMFAFGSLPKLEQIGYECARKQIGEWRDAGEWLLP